MYFDGIDGGLILQIKTFGIRESWWSVGCALLKLHHHRTLARAVRIVLLAQRPRGAQLSLLFTIEYTARTLDCELEKVSTSEATDDHGTQFVPVVDDDGSHENSLSGNTSRTRPMIQTVNKIKRQ